MAATKYIRDAREAKNLSADAVAEAAGLSYSRYIRIEEGSGRTTPEEQKQVLEVIKGMEKGTRKLVGRPFKDAEQQARFEAARAEGKSVAEALGHVIVTKAPDKAPAAKKDDKVDKALQSKTPARARKAPKAAAPAESEATAE